MSTSVADGFTPGSQIILQSLTMETGLVTVLVAEPSTGSLTMANTSAGNNGGAYWLVVDAGQTTEYNGQTIAGLYFVSMASSGGNRFLNGDTSSGQVTLVGAPGTEAPAVWYPVSTSIGGYCLACAPGPSTTESSVWLTNNNNPGPGPNLSLWSISNQGTGVRNSWWQPLPVTFSASL